MSERNLNGKRESRELEASIISPLKKKKTTIDDSLSDSHNIVLAIPSPSAASSLGRFSVTSEDDATSSIVSSGRLSNESNETDTTLSESETESSPAIKRKKSPTEEEIEEFLSELESGDDKQKRFIEKYNFDIVNDKPLQGRYMWDRLKP